MISWLFILYTLVAVAVFGVILGAINSESFKEKFPSGRYILVHHIVRLGGPSTAFHIQPLPVH